MIEGIGSIVRSSWIRICGTALLGSVILSACLPLPGPPGGGAGDPIEALARRGWRTAEPVRVIGPQNLYEEIDGEAELYLPYSFRELRVAILAPADRPAAQVRLELYRHGSSRDAYGIYSQYRFPGQETTRVGSSEAIASGSSLDFFRGEYFVRIRAAGRQVSRGDLERLGKDLAALLPGSASFPREAEALRIPGSAPGPVAFHRRAMLGYEALAPGFEARIDDGEVSGRILLISGEDVGPASLFRKRLSKSLPGFSSAGGDIFRADLPSGTLWLLSRSGYQLGFVGKATRAQAEAILGILDGRARLVMSGRDPKHGRNGK